jgi:gas vesicle protein
MMPQNILNNETTSMDSSMNHVKTSFNSTPSNAGSTSAAASSSSSANSKMMKGILIGGVIGGVLAMLDSNTRTKVKDAAVNVKDSSVNMISEVKNNPGDVKEQMMGSFKDASKVLKEAINDAQNLYERLNKDMFGKVSEAKEITSEAVTTAMEAKDELAEIGSKVKEAGATVMDNPVVDAAGEGTSSSTSSNTSSMGVKTSDSGTADAYATGMDSKPKDTPELGNTSNTLSIPPEDQMNKNNR